MTTLEDQSRDPSALKAKAEHYRELTSEIINPMVIEALFELADRYDALALELETRRACRP